MGRQWLRRSASIIETQGAGDGLTFGSRFLLTTPPPNDQVDWRSRRNPLEVDLGSGPYRIDIEKAHTPEIGGDVNTDLIEMIVSIGDRNMKIMYEYVYGRNARYGDMWSVNFWPNGTQFRGEGHLPGAYFGTLPSEARNSSTISFTLPEPNMVYIEAFRKVGHMSWSDSGSNRRTNWSGITAYSLPHRHFFPSNSDTLKIEFNKHNGAFSPDMVVAFSYLGG